MQFLQDAPRQRGITALVVGHARLVGPPHKVLASAPRRGTAGHLPELGRGLWSSPGRGQQGGLLEGGGDGDRGDALEHQLHPFPRFTINAKGLGVFPDLKRPRVLWVGLGGNELAVLASKVESALEPLGFAREKRGFTPHLTVGRWRQFDGSGKKLAQELESWKHFNFGDSRVVAVILFQSVLKPQGALYFPLKTVPLAK